jgi:hypothetical protein
MGKEKLKDQSHPNRLDPADNHWMKQIIAFRLVGIGFLLLILSYFWVSWFPGNSTWTREKEEGWSKVKVRMHNIGFTLSDPKTSTSMHSGPDRGTAKAELDQLKKEYDQYATEFQSAYDRPRTASKYMKWSGIGLVALGLIGWYAVKQTE